jgi:hypothetical protein
VEETFFRMTRHREFDAAEMSLSSYPISLDQDAPFVAIPAFVSRAFRHNGIYAGAASRVTDRPGWRAGWRGWPSTSSLPTSGSGALWPNATGCPSPPSGTAPAGYVI